MSKVMSFEDFVYSAKITHYDDLTEDQKNHAPNYEGCVVVVFAGGPAICKAAPDVYWFEDYKERIVGAYNEVVEKFYDYLVEQDSLTTITDDDFGIDETIESTEYEMGPA